MIPIQYKGQIVGYATDLNPSPGSCLDDAPKITGKLHFDKSKCPGELIPLIKQRAGFMLSLAVSDKPEIVLTIPEARQ